MYCWVTLLKLAISAHAAACLQVFGLRRRHSGCKYGDDCKEDCKDDTCDKCEKCEKDDKDCKDGCKEIVEVRLAWHGCTRQSMAYLLFMCTRGH